MQKNSNILRLYLLKIAADFDVGARGQGIGNGNGNGNC